MESNIVVALLAVILGGGGVGGIGLAVNAFRAHKKGKIEDDGTLIERLNAEAKDLTAARKVAEGERDVAHQREQRWMDQSFRYRMQLATATPPIKPDDDPALWKFGTPQPVSEDG